MKKLIIASLLTMAMASLASASTTVTMLGTYSNASADTSANTWGMYALDTLDNDGISYVSFKVANVLTANNTSEENDSFRGDGTTNKSGKFGFSSNQDCNDLGGGAFEIICGQSPADLQTGKTDPKTGYAFFLKHLGQQAVTYSYVANKQGTDIETSTIGQLMTIGGITGYWFEIGSGTLAQGVTPVVQPYANGTASANIVQAGTTTTVAVGLATAAFVPEPATMALLAFGGIAALVRRRSRRA
jgi:hypothetical protein